MNIFQRIALFFTKLSPQLSTVVVYEFDGSTRTLTTARLDAVTRKSFLKHMFKTYNPKLIEVDGEPFGKFGKHIKALKS